MMQATVSNFNRLSYYSTTIRGICHLLPSTVSSRGRWFDNNASVHDYGCNLRPKWYNLKPCCQTRSMSSEKSMNVTFKSSSSPKTSDVTFENNSSKDIEVKNTESKFLKLQSRENENLHRFLNAEDEEMDLKSGQSLPVANKIMNILKQGIKTKQQNKLEKKKHSIEELTFTKSQKNKPSQKRTFKSSQKNEPSQSSSSTTEIIVAKNTQSKLQSINADKDFDIFEQPS